MKDKIINKQEEIQEDKAKFKLGIVGSSPDGDRIFCIYKLAGKLIIRGFYDFNKNTFIIITFNPNNLQDIYTPEYALNKFAYDLMDEFDWEFTGLNKILELINKGESINKKKQRKKKNKK